MSFADMVECADDTALENGEIVFSAIDMNEAAEARIFDCGMVYSSVARKFFAQFRVGGIFVGRQI
jgi:hypothetical protein